MTRTLVFILTALALSASPAAAQQGEVLLRHHNQFLGDQPLRFSKAGTALSPKGARLSYRVIRSEAEWKKMWGYLYDGTLKVDFKKHRVLVIYKSPAKGQYTLKPRKVLPVGNRLSVEVEVTWSGSKKRGHPFLALVVDPFRGLDVEEKFVAPGNKEVQYP